MRRITATVEATSMQTTSDALALLPIPRLEKLTDRQVRGLACIWDGVPLVNSTAVDLGVRQTTRAGDPVSWYPRACRPCTSKAALSQLHEHAPGCTACCGEETAPSCETGRGLYRMARDYQR